jgi:V/A-type H+/Na+-transporting ATPase subunit D
MPSQSVAPTKSNLLRERERLALAEEGYDLLERKREILMLELMKRIGEARQLERDIEKAAGEAYPALRRSLLSGGLELAREAAAGVRQDFAVAERREQVAGISMRSLEAEPPERLLQVSFGDSSVDTDEASARFAAFLRLLVDMAGLQSIIWRLAREVRKTQRRVNALEKMVIPESKATKAYIEASLEERERESVFSTKLLKARKAAEARS